MPESCEKIYHSADQVIRECFPHFWLQEEIVRIATKYPEEYHKHDFRQTQMQNLIEENGLDIFNLPDYLSEDVRSMLFQNLPPRYVGEVLADNVLENITRDLQ